MDLNYKDEEFERLQYNVYPVKKGELFTEFPELDAIDEFKIDLDFLNSQRENVIKYIIYVYDPKSPLSKESLTERKQIAAQLVGWNPKNGRFHTNIVDIFMCENDAINTMIVKFCITISPSFGLWISGMEAYEAILKDLLAKPTGKRDPVKMSAEKADLFEKSEKMLDRLNLLERKILNQEKAKELREELYKIAAKKEPLRLRPEHKAIRG